MATNLQQLRVSLTKHGAHKVAFLIIKFDKDDILNNLSGNYLDINIDHAQACNILSVDKNGFVPDLWNNIKKYGEQDVYDIVFIANIFSHIDLINTMINAIENGCVIENGSIIGEKAFTNFAHTIDEFGYSIEHTPDLISFDISRIFHKFYLTKFIAEILKIKLIEAGWDQNNSLIEECVKNDFHKVFGLSIDDFEIWLNGAIEIAEKKISKVKAKRNFKDGLKFTVGHQSKYEGEVSIKESERHSATLLHNQIQNKIFKLLQEKYPSDEIGTEIPSNSGSIDIVRKHDNKFFFYEIKTADNTKTNIRLALSQLLEYAYWNDIQNIEALIIIAPSVSTEDSKNYITLLRDKFSIPIFFQYFDIKNNYLNSEE